MTLSKSVGGAFIFCLVLIAFGCAPYKTTGPLTVEQILTMPYNSVSISLAPEIEEIPKRLPMLGPGESLLFFLNGQGEQVMQAFSEDRIIKMSQPLFSPRLSLINKKGNFSLSKAMNSTDAISLEGAVSTHKSKQSVKSQHHQGNVSVSNALDSLASHTVFGASMQSHQHSIVTQHDNINSGMQAAKASLGTGLSEQSGGVESHSKGLNVSAYSSGSGSVSFFSRSMLESMARGGRMSGLNDFSLMQAVIEELLKNGELIEMAAMGTLVEEYFKNQLENYYSKQGWLDGDLKQIVFDDGMYNPSPAEIDQFSSIVRGNPKLLELLIREYSERFRDAKESKTGYEITAHVSSVLDDDKHYHGHPVGLVTSIVNIGTEPLYDVLILTGVPEHTDFKDFLDNAPEEKGFLHYYLPERNLILTKLYRPIFSGERFNDLALYKFVPWQIQMITARKEENSLNTLN